MKRLLISSCMFLILAAVNNVTAQEKVKVKDDKTKVKNDNGKMKMKGKDAMMAYPYTATYSSNFVMGDPANAQLVLNAWKDWDENNLDRHDFVADTIVFFTPDGQVMRGKEATMTGLKKYRSGLTSSSSTVDAWMPLRSTDRNENWVAIWGTETDVYPDGKTTKSDIHEIWRINKDGKVDFIKQYAATTPQPK